jgi:hypothetical protein
MTIDAIRALRHMGDSDRDDLFDFCRKGAVGKNGLTECFKGSCWFGAKSRRMRAMSGWGSG